MDEVERLKEELAQTKVAYETLMQIDHLKTGFLGRIAHELRSPLASLMGLHQLILTDLCESPAEERECIAQAYQAAGRLLKIIDSTVNVSKIEYGTIPLELEKISIERVLAELYQLTYLQAANRNLKLEILPANLSVIADRQRLLHVLLLLVDGGISLLDRGKIRVSASLSENARSGLIQIHLDCPPNLWSQEVSSEPTRLAGTADIGLLVDTSLYLKFLLSQKLLTMMHGEIHHLESEPEGITLIQILLPLEEDGTIQGKYDR